jgi:hypothetical protein
VADALTRKQEDVKTQKNKDVAARTQTLIKPDMVFVEDTPLIAALQPSDIGPKPYELINAILTSNRAHDSLKVFRERAGKE